jgi:hypothetical protein
MEAGGRPPSPRDASVHANRNGDFMTRRPISLTLTAWVFIVVGAGGILKDVLPLLGPGRAAALAALRFEGPAGLALIWFIRSLAVVGGIAVLWRRTWGRWLLAAWMVFHVVVSLFHSTAEAAAHVAIFAVLAYALFRPPAGAYFARTAAIAADPTA